MISRSNSINNDLNIKLNEKVYKYNSFYYDVKHLIHALC